MRGQGTSASGSHLLFGTRKKEPLENFVDLEAKRKQKLLAKITDEYQRRGIPRPEMVSDFSDKTTEENFIRIKLTSVEEEFRKDAESDPSNMVWVTRYQKLKELLEAGETHVTVQVVYIPGNIHEGIDTTSWMLGVHRTVFYEFET